MRYLMAGSAVQNENIFRMEGIGTGEAAKVAQDARAGKASMMQAIQSEQETADADLVYGVETPAAVQERRKLRRSPGRADTALLMLAAIIVLDTLGAESSSGAHAFTWLIVMVIFFLVPFGLAPRRSSRSGRSTAGTSLLG